LNWLRAVGDGTDPVFFAIISEVLGRSAGVSSFLRINSQDGSIEVGHRNSSPLLQKTKEATEAVFLMMKWAFQNGYCGYEWMCYALNINSRKASQKLGFAYEGTFRQVTVVKTRNQDTALFSIIDKEWKNLEQPCLEYSSEENFDENQVQRIFLASLLTKPLLYKLDGRG
jgi:RimJ/RimL family protein N-acetyltransferase